MLVQNSGHMLFKCAGNTNLYPWTYFRPFVGIEASSELIRKYGCERTGMIILLIYWYTHEIIPQSVHGGVPVVIAERIKSMIEHGK